MRIKVETKISIALFIFCIEVFMLMFVLFMVNRQHEQNIHKQHNELEKVSLVSSLQLALSQVVMPANDFLILGGAPNEVENFKLIDSKAKDLIEKLNRFGFRTTEEKELLDHIENEYSQVKEIALQIFAFPGAVGNAEAGKIMEKMDKIADDASNDAEMFYNFTRQGMVKTEKEIYKVKVFFDIVILAGILFNIILILFGVFFFRRIITSPINSIRDVVLEVGAGNLKRRINIRSNDEIGDLANSFNKMIEDLKRLIQREKELTAIAGMAADAEKKRARGKSAIMSQRTG